MEKTVKTLLIVILSVILLTGPAVAKVRHHHHHVAHHPRIRRHFPEVRCLAEVIYMEERGEHLKNQIAVALVAVNLMRSQHESICAIVWRGRRFPWAKHHFIIKKGRTWDHALWLAREVLDGHFHDFTKGATMFYNSKLAHPKWASDGIVTLRFHNGDIFLRPKDNL